MIITQLNGGLGNQLFQYAAGRALAHKHNTILKCDLSHFNNSTTRKYDLDFFKAVVQKASYEDVNSIIPKSFLQKAVQRLLPNHKRKAYREPHFHFDKNFFFANHTVYLKGNWQSEKYFKPIETIIRSEFQIKEPFVNHLEGKVSELKKRNSVCVHIRRGDYLKPDVLAYHGILSKDYYNKAVKNIVDKMPDAVFYIFSDDAAWVKENISFDKPHTFMSGIETNTAIEDFHLMQNCRHAIIANSSFSWWAAWLNLYPEKMIIAPKAWFNKGPSDTYDIFPEKWVLI